jgi:hypothetical protein
MSSWTRIIRARAWLTAADRWVTSQRHVWTAQELAAIMASRTEPLI